MCVVLCVCFIRFDFLSVRFIFAGQFVADC